MFACKRLRTNRQYEDSTSSEEDYPQDNKKSKGDHETITEKEDSQGNKNSKKDDDTTSEELYSPGNKNGKGDNENGSEEEDSQANKEHTKASSPVIAARNIFELPGNCKVSVKVSDDKLCVDIRRYNKSSSGHNVPLQNEGILLSMDQWDVLRDLIPDIHRAVEEEL